MVFGGGAFGKRLSLNKVMGVELPGWDWCPSKGKKGSELSLPGKHTARKQGSANQEEDSHSEPSHAGSLVSGFQPPEL